MCYTCGCKLPYENHGDRVAAKTNMLDLLQEEQRRGELDEPRESHAKEAADPKQKKS